MIPEAWDRPKRAMLDSISMQVFDGSGRQHLTQHRGNIRNAEWLLQLTNMGGIAVLFNEIPGHEDYMRLYSARRGCGNLKPHFPSTWTCPSAGKIQIAQCQVVISLAHEFQRFLRACRT